MFTSTIVARRARAEIRTAPPSILDAGVRGTVEGNRLPTRLIVRAATLALDTHVASQAVDAVLIAAAPATTRVTHAIRHESLAVGVAGALTITRIDVARGISAARTLVVARARCEANSFLRAGGVRFATNRDIVAVDVWHGHFDHVQFLAIERVGWRDRTMTFAVDLEADLHVRRTLTAASCAWLPSGPPAFLCHALVIGGAERPKAARVFSADPPHVNAHDRAVGVRAAHWQALVTVDLARRAARLCAICLRAGVVGGASREEEEQGEAGPGTKHAERLHADDAASNTNSRSWRAPHSAVGPQSGLLKCEMCELLNGSADQS